MVDVLIPIAICFVAGITLLVVEALVPGFGLPGVSGIVLCGASIVITWVNYGSIAALGLTIVVLAVMAIAVSTALRSVANGRLSKSGFILKNTESTQEGYTTSEDLDVFLGREGITTTVLRPTGIAEFDGVRLNVMTDGEYVQPNTSVKITAVDGSRIMVKRLGA